MPAWLVVVCSLTIGDMFSFLLLDYFGWKWNSYDELVGRKVLYDTWNGCGIPVMGVRTAACAAMILRLPPGAIDCIVPGIGYGIVVMSVRTVMYRVW